MLKSCMTLVVTLFLAVQGAHAGTVTNLDARQAYELLQQRPEVFLLDVRSPQEYGQVRLANAHLIPIDQFIAREREVPKDKPILVYCAVGQRSEKVADYLARKGYPEVYDLKGGIWGWQLRKLPVLTGLP